MAKIYSGTALSTSGTHKDINLCIGAELAPIPPKLVTRIKAGEFVDMAKLRMYCQTIWDLPLLRPYPDLVSNAMPSQISLSGLGASVLTLQSSV